MSHYDSLTDEEKIKLAQSSMRYRVPIAPALVRWLHDEGLHEQVTNPPKGTQ